MAITRVLRTSSSPIHLAGSSSTNSSSLMTSVRCRIKANLNADDILPQKVERKPMVAPKASVAESEHIITSQPVIPRGLLELVPNIGRVIQSLLTTTTIVKSIKQWNLHPQMLLEKAIIDCRFFTLFAVVGSLVGSVLCFVEGCFLVMQSYVECFHIMSKRVDQGHVMKLLIEAVDMFLVGTAMLVFGVGLYVMFVGSKTDKEETEPWVSGSNLLGLFSMKSTPRWVGMQSIAKAKSRIGHAVMMVLQVGLLEKFNDIPLVTGSDLACFAAAVLTSSACIFLLSRLHR